MRAHIYILVVRVWGSSNALDALCAVPSAAQLTCSRSSLALRSMSRMASGSVMTLVRSPNFLGPALITTLNSARLRVNVCVGSAVEKQEPVGAAAAAAAAAASDTSS